MQTIFPHPNRNPYYIVAPPFTRMSAGIKVLHLLCHSLNLRGQNAFMTTAETDPSLLTPILTDKIIDQHFNEGLTPIVVYPEIINGNPLAAPVIARYILNFPGLIGGDLTYEPEEICFGYSVELVRGLEERFRKNFLFLPASDTSVYNLDGVASVRKGSCFYAGKYQAVHHEPLLEITKDAVEIHGPLSKKLSQSPQEIAALFKRSEVFYCYENSALAIEAGLCGCPTVFLPNTHFTHKIGNELLGDAGMAWGNDPTEVQRAKETVSKFPARYEELVVGFWKQLEHFVSETAQVAQAVPYVAKIRHTHIGVTTEIGSEIRVPQSRFGKLAVVILLVARLLQTAGPLRLTASLLKALSDGGVKSVKRSLKHAYFEHFDWIRSQLI